jgi:hypothetical protein
MPTLSIRLRVISFHLIFDRKRPAFAIHMALNVRVHGAAHFQIRNPELEIRNSGIPAAPIQRVVMPPIHDEH